VPLKKNILSICLLLITATSIGANSSPHFSDSSILQIVRVLNRGEFDLGELAYKKSKDKQVDKFAKMMMKDHSANLVVLQATSERQGIVYLESDISREMKMRSDAKLEQLASLEGSLFDQAYIEAMVSAHKDALNKFDEELIPAATDRQIRKMLIKMKQGISMHYQHAVEIQKKRSNQAK
jgi:putative membrane protein